MKRTHIRTHRAAWIALGLVLAAPAAAQEVAPPPSPNADRLAEQMRVLAKDPRNVDALLSAGELSARLNDPAAAAGFFARAQALDPANPRLQAGQAMVMLRMERPGEALRLFSDAARRGLSMEGYASDRGLAYDLLGAQAHAQRDHRIAMRLNPDDETIRRFALSLGISGQEAEAMQVLDPLLRRSDRAAWRARAFIMAMNGDAVGADKIAASMMGGFGTALSPFFRRLPSLSPSDKAFAVTFGELRHTPARIADAQAAPPLPTLPPERGVAVAAAQVPPAPARDARRLSGAERRQGAPRQRRDEVAEREAAAKAEQDRQVALKAEQERAAALKAEQDRQAARVAEQQRQAALAAEQARVAQLTRDREAARIAAEQQAAREAEARRIAEAQARERAAAQSVAQAPPPPPPPPPPQPAAAPPSPSPSPSLPASTTPASTPPAAGERPVQMTTPSAPAPAQPVRRVGGEDNVIARIVAGITIPASELGVEPMPGREPDAQASEPAPQPATTAPADVAKPEPARAEPAAPRPKAEPKAVARPEPKPAPARAKPKPDPAKTDPARVWVQVAGGANVAALPREWKQLTGKAAAEFRGKQAWTTPLRFTNRLLTGPFKNEDEAQEFVNQIAKKGLSGFVWTSDPGQKIEKLTIK
ncbi:SPOR domain-containing protein [Sphingomonas sp.]|uniref:SPOR domain-containing protein n=1 Tax=Sphingomonas sp. TaxID=28214 RepID=UPI001EC4048C|nr:SPOR domain-containing protein [Sphingomonas sp.]MBX3594300.1 SPOR domain-containing protein [Sphingomonas sp.]